MSGARQVFVSPHPDDVVWSCGGRLAALVAAARPVAVITVFDGDPPHVPAEAWRRIALPRRRRAEDARVLAALGAERHSLGFVDAALRANPAGVPLYASSAELFGELHASDHGLAAEVAARLLPLLDPADVVHAPLAMGQHVDHRIVRSSVDTLRRPAAWYEEFPYTRQTELEGFTAEDVAVDFSAWLASAAGYRSQVLGLFGSTARFAAALRAHAQRGANEPPAYAERCWRRIAPR